MIRISGFANSAKPKIAVFTIFTIILLFFSGTAVAAAIQDNSVYSDRFLTETIEQQSENAGVRYPATDMSYSKGVDIISKNYTFSYNFENITLNLETDKKMLLAARKTNKNIWAKSSLTKRKEWVAGYYLSLIADPVNTETYESVVSELGKVRDEKEMDSDEYAEFIVKFVQSLPYSSTGSAPKYPVETISDASGDCDDKSMLLAAILTIEGYDTEMMYYENQSHVAAGIGTGSENKFAYIETTKTLPVGTVPGIVGNKTFDPKDPITIQVSKDGMKYTKANRAQPGN
ncbi:hypothetical protein J2128_001610 [Methanomicrobium sp. W14]|uniref:hypothetical protein n=1 Tax=Methanomicrobium sp. W14 TaxID=2817839 RepID=UPI001AE622FE|nr:hypothetical protein [Methanomicrobium sp. W14]MBP2133656.1 hypothetical protein [Methanomicrobium sp. W14]